MSQMNQLPFISVTPSVLRQAISPVSTFTATNWPQGVAVQGVGVQHEPRAACEQFRQYLDKNGLSQKKVAEHLEVSRNTIAYYLSGKWPIPKVFSLALKALEDEL